MALLKSKNKISRWKVALLLLLARAAWAQSSEIDVLNKAIEDYNDGRNQRAAIGFYQIEETAAVEDNRYKAEYYLAQALNKLGLGFSSFFYYGQVIKAGPTHPYYYKAVEGAVAVTEQYRDEVLGPNVLNKAYNDQFGRLPPEVLAKINYYIALLGYRGGKYDEAEQFLRGVPPESSAYPQARYLIGLLQQRKAQELAVKTFRNILDIEGSRYRDLENLKELTHLAHTPICSTTIRAGRWASCTAFTRRTSPTSSRPSRKISLPSSTPSIACIPRSAK